jgi:molybdopterin-guanine dinucleotide biosynthesis adapter protein
MSLAGNIACMAFRQIILSCYGNRRCVAAMTKPCFIGIVGHKKSGKTTLVERLTAELTSRGLSVGTIKMTTHDLQFDSPGKDTHRHRTAGSRVTLIKSQNEHAVFTSAQYLDDDIIRTIFSLCDFVLIEGDTSSGNPKIYISDSREIRPDIAGEIIAVWGEKNDNLIARHFNSDQISELGGYIMSEFGGKD